MIKTAFKPILLAIITLSPLTATANEGKGAELETIAVTANRIEKQLSEQSISLSIVGSEDIQNTGHTHISELLNQVPGVWISRGNGQEHLTAIRSAVLTGTGSSTARARLLQCE